jgi:hypothetical protein
MFVSFLAPKKPIFGNGLKALRAHEAPLYFPATFLISPFTWCSVPSASSLALDFMIFLLVNLDLTL